MTIRQALAFARNPNEMSIAEDFLKQLDAFCEKARAAGWEVDVDEDFNDEDGDYTQVMMKYTNPDSNQSVDVWIFPRNTSENLREWLLRETKECASYLGEVDPTLKEKVNELQTLLD